MSDPTPTQDEADALQHQALGIDPTHVPPSVVDVPAVGGGSAPGATLTCTMGNWNGMDNEPSDYAYSWRDGNRNLGSGDTYLIAEEDVGSEICCLVTASNAYGSTMAPPSNKVTIAAVGTQAARQAERAGPPSHRGGRGK